MGEYGIYIVVFFAVMICAGVISELVLRRRAVGVRLSETTAKPSADDLQLGDGTLVDLGEAENRLIRRYFEITRRDQNANSTQNRLIRAGYFGARAVTVFQVVRALLCGVLRNASVLRGRA